MMHEMDGRAFQRGPTLRAVLFAGFGLTLGVWLLVGAQFTRRVTALQDTATAISTRYSRAQDNLARVRRETLLAAVLVRDALLDPERHGAEGYGAQIDAAMQSADTALAGDTALASDTPSSLQEIELLRGELTQFHQVMLKVLREAGPQSSAEARSLLRREINPRRDLVVGISESLQAMNRDAFIALQASSASESALTQRQMWRLLGLAMLAGLSIALVATLYASRLEKRLRVQRDQQLQDARDLRRLSARVIRVQEDERRAIARELHDEVGQVLTAIKVELATAQRAIDAHGGDHRLLQKSRSIADGALHTVKDLSRLLHPAVVDDLGLSAALDWYLRDFSARHGIEATFFQAHMEEARLPPPVELAVYRVVQEALTNVARHANATACSVSLRRWPEVLVVSVEDNGKGFDLERTASPSGLGLIGIRERVAQVHGHLRIETAPGRGTRLVVDLVVASLPPTEFAFADEAAGLAVVTEECHG